MLAEVPTYAHFRIRGFNVFVMIGRKLHGFLPPALVLDFAQRVALAGINPLVVEIIKYS